MKKALLISVSDKTLDLVTNVLRKKLTDVWTLSGISFVPDDAPASVFFLRR